MCWSDLWENLDLVFKKAGYRRLFGAQITESVRKQHVVTQICARIARSSLLDWSTCANYNVYRIQCSLVCVYYVDCFVVQIVRSFHQKMDQHMHRMTHARTHNGWMKRFGAALIACTRHIWGDNNRGQKSMLQNSSIIYRVLFPTHSKKFKKEQELVKSNNFDK